MGNGTEGSPELESATPLELALDRATDQYLASLEERRGRRRSSGRPSTTAMVVDGQQEVLPARLSWRGIEVTEEFQEYAMRVARGEQLAPFRGQVLAHPCPEFPWGEREPEQHTSTEALPRFRSRGPRVAAWIFGVGALVLVALGVGTGTANPALGSDSLSLSPSSGALAPRPGAGADEARSRLDDDAPETRIASAIEGALAAAVPTGGAAPDSAAPGADAEGSSSVGVSRPSVATSRPPTLSAAVPSSGAGSSLRATLSAGGLGLPPSATAASARAAGGGADWQRPASDALASAPLATAGVVSAASAAGPTGASALFSERAPF